MGQVTIGLIGMGDILSSHLAGLKANPDFNVVGVCDKVEDKVRHWTRELGCRGFLDFRDLLDEAPDVATVVLPHGLHCDVSLQALEAGCHVLVEKPMAVSVEECNRMLRAAREHGKHLLVTEACDFEPGALLTGRRFKAGGLGRFLTGSIVNARAYFHEGRPLWFLNPAMSGGGMFSNVGVHRLAVARACLPRLEPVFVSACVRRVPEYEVEACTSAIVGYKGGCSMLYEEVGYFPKPEWLNVGTHFVFEEGIVGWDENAWRVLTRDGGQTEEALPPRGAPYGPVYAAMLRAVRGEQCGPGARGNALDVAVAQAAYASARDGRQVDLTSPPWRIARTGET